MWRLLVSAAVVGQRFCILGGETIVLGNWVTPSNCEEITRVIRLPLLIAAFLLPCAGVAQTVSIGLVAGVPLTEAFETAAFDSGLVAGVRTQINYASRAKRYTVGPAVEVSLPFGLALEFDALYKRLDYNFSSSVRPGLFGTFNEEQD